MKGLRSADLTIELECNAERPLNPGVTRSRRFGAFVLDEDGRELRRDGQPVPLVGKPFELLLAFTRNPGRLLTKAELMDTLWPGTAVEESNLTQTVFVLRKALGQEADSGTFIQTMPRQGYKFVVPVTEGPLEVTFEERTRSSLVVESEAVTPRRWQSRWAFAGVAVAALAVGAWFWVARNRAGLAARVETVVVLPFVNLSGSVDEEYLSDGFTEEVTAALTGAPGLKVVARTTAFQYKGKQVDVREIAARMQADAVLSGSVRREGDRLRITAQLSNGRDGYQLWSRTWNRSAREIIASQEDVARNVVATLRPEQASRLVARAFSSNPQAYNDYLRGRYLWRRNLSDPQLRKSIGAFEDATRKDPGFGAAYAGLADCYQVLLYAQLAPAREVLPKAKAASSKALELAPDLSYAHTVRAFILFVGDWNMPEAEREYRRALELDPADPTAHHHYSHFLSAMGRHQESLQESQRAIDLDPMDPAWHAHVAWVYTSMPTPDPRKALAACERALEIDPVSPQGLIYARKAYELLGDFAAAADRTEQLKMPADFVQSLRKAAASSGAKGYWRAWLRFNESGARRSFNAFDSARFASQSGDVEIALRSLEQAYANREPGLVHLRHDPAFRNLRDDLRFQAIAAKVGLPR